MGEVEQRCGTEYLSLPPGSLVGLADGAGELLVRAEALEEAVGRAYGAVAEVPDLGVGVAIGRIDLQRGRVLEPPTARRRISISPERRSVLMSRAFWAKSLWSLSCDWLGS